MNRNERTFAQLEALASWNRRDREADTPRIQVHAGGTWRNVLSIAPELADDYVDALQQIVELLPQVRWRLTGPGVLETVIGGAG